MDHRLLLVICTALVWFSALTIALSSGFFMKLLGARIAAVG
jgi:small neutral amino acid transporter SnatA (MarC family)